MTLHDHKLLSAIRKEEFIVQMWGDAENEAQAKFTNNLTNMIDEFNYVSFWAATEICLLPDVNDRADMLKRFIVIAKECMRYNNYNSSMALVTGLNVAAVQRLKHTWSLIPSQLLKTLRELEKLMHPHGNFAAYRESNKDPPCIPFFGLYLKVGRRFCLTWAGWSVVWWCRRRCRGRVRRARMPFARACCVSWCV